MAAAAVLLSTTNTLASILYEERALGGNISNGGVLT